eukprot:GFUD01118899.1.p1 GENE.GFUD01118899.1~~GFUD01118899.1.p1  ORF type:complete len:179 (+),score=51.20 GFUD01118899.1:248-784(+)
MGCLTSKEGTTFQQKNVRVKDCDHVTGLSKKQRFLLKGSWKGVSREFESTGVLWLVELFTTHPPTRACFTQFSLLGLDGELQECEEFRQHAEQVMERIDNALFSMEDPDTMKSILLETGAYHRRVVGFRPEMFQFAEEPLLNALRCTLDERYTPQMEVIYSVIVQFMTQTLIEGYNGG